MKCSDFILDCVNLFISYNSSLLLRGTTSIHVDDFDCLSCLHSFKTKSKIKSHEKVSENKDF